MANNPYVNKVQKADGTVLIDISDTTAVASDVASGKCFYTADGAKVQGTATGGGTGAISVVDTPDSHGGTIRTITAVDISDTTAVAADVAHGKYFYTANGTKTQGTASGSPSVTQHTIYFEFTDETDTTIPVYYDDALIGTMITAYKPVTYGQKTVSLAQLDGVTWYEPANIPIGVELIDYTSLTSNTSIDSQGEVVATEWYYTSDYTAVDENMTFSYAASMWHYIGIYDENKNVLRTIYAYTDATPSAQDANVGIGTLSGNKLLNAKFVRICSSHQSSPGMSLIRTA